MLTGDDNILRVRSSLIKNDTVVASCSVPTSFCRRHCADYDLGQRDEPHECPASILANRIGWSGQGYHRLHDLRTTIHLLLLTPARQQKLEASWHDLDEFYNPYAAHVLSVLETNSKVVNAGLRFQIDELLAKPWQATVAQRKVCYIPVFVVDALGENDRGTEFLEELLRVIHASQLASSFL